MDVLTVFPPQGALRAELQAVATFLISAGQPGRRRVGKGESDVTLALLPHPRASRRGVGMTLCSSQQPHPHLASRLWESEVSEAGWSSPEERSLNAEH